ncbi:hypothetical protein OYT40_002167 [Escherichia coli]|nr:hypothetical protein [Escherichia coli]
MSTPTKKSLSERLTEVITKLEENIDFLSHKELAQLVAFKEYLKANPVTNP